MRAEIEGVVFSLRGKFNVQDGIDRVAKHGTNAVPFLIEMYGRTELERRWFLAACLCQISSDESFSFLKTILRNHEDQQATTQIIRRFPLDHEDQIILPLVDLLGVVRHSFESQDRLRQMIFRKPSRAGDLVRAMDSSDKSMVGRNWHIGEVLAYVSGFSHTWCCSGPSATDWGKWQREFWELWWQRNRDKEPLDWLVETFRSDPKNISRQEQALQVIASLNESSCVPILLEGLNSQSERVRYWAIIGLQRLDGTANPNGNRWETSLEERARVIEQLRQKFSGQTNKFGAAQQGSADRNQTTPVSR